jgi:hypothetical protein
MTVALIAVIVILVGAVAALLVGRLLDRMRSPAPLSGGRFPRSASTGS